MFKRILLILAIICLMTMSVFAVSGTYTDNGYFYLPGYGSYGTAEFDEYNAYMQIADTQIKANVDRSKWVYPQDYATGTGTDIDPWVGWRAAAYTTCPTGGTIYMRAGYYELDAILVIQKAINIVGEGIGRTIIITAEAGHGIKIDGDGYPADYTTIRDLTVDGDAQLDDTTACIAVSMVTYILIENVETKNGGKFGIDWNTVSYSYVHNLYTHDNYRQGIHPGTDTVGGNRYNTYRNIWAWNNLTGDGFSDRGSSVDPELARHNVYDGIIAWNNGRSGIGLDLLSGCTLSNSVTYGNAKDGIYLADIQDFVISNCIANNNSSFSPEFSGIWLGAVTLSTCENIHFSNVIAKNNYGRAGITLDDTDNVSFTSCQSYNDLALTAIDISFHENGGDPDTIEMADALFVYEGFLQDEVGNPANDLVVSGSTFNDGAYTIEAVAAGVLTLSDGDLTEEAAGDTVTLTQYPQDYGLQLDTANTNTSLINCKLAPNATGAINNVSASTITTLMAGIVDDYAATQGDVMYHNGTNWIRLAKGTAEQRLKMNAGATAPEWDTLTESDVTDLGAYITDVSGDAIGALSDVGDGTPTNLYVLIGDGDSWESRVLVEADISDLGSYLENLLEDATPELADDLDCNNEDLIEVKTVQFNGVYAIGNSGATETIDWQNGAYQSITLDEACVISFSNEYVGTLNLRVTYGGSFALTFDGGVTLLEEGGVEIVTTDASGVDVLIFKNWGTADTYDMGALLDVRD